MPLSFTAKIVVFLLTFTPLVLTILTYLSPAQSDHRISLITVSPLKVSTDPGSTTDGPTVSIGVFGSCSQQSNAAKSTCVSGAFPSKFDLSALPSNIPNVLVLPGFFTALLWTALVFWVLGIVSIYVSDVYVIQRFEKYKFREWAKITTHITLLIAFVIWVVVVVFYRKAAADFNACLLIEGQQAPALSAKLGSAVFLIGPAYACTAGLYVITRNIQSD